LTVDGAYLNLGPDAERSAWLAHNAYAGAFNGEATNAYVSVVNGSTVAASRFAVGCLSDASKAAVDIRPSVTVDASTFTASYGVVLSGRAGCQAQWTVTNSAVLATGPQTEWNGGADIALTDGSVWREGADGSSLTLALGASAAGVCRVASGATFCCAQVTTSGTLADGAVTLLFDGGNLVPGASDATIALPTGCALASGADGLLLPVPETKTWTVQTPIAGTRIVRNTGAGTVSFGNAQTRAVVSGPGSFAQATLARGGVAVAVGPGGTVGDLPLLTDVSFAGRQTVVFSRADATPLGKSELEGLRVARVAGSTTCDVPCRLKGTDCGEKAVGRLSVSDGYLVLTDVAEQSGLQVIVR